MTTKTNSQKKAGANLSKQLSKNRETYTEIWDDQIRACKTLAFCSDEELSKEILKTIEHLRTLVPKVASLKTSFSGWAFEGGQ
jgi:HSP90 family molecular chaperone